VQKIDLPAKNVDTSPTIDAQRAACAHPGVTIRSERIKFTLPGNGCRGLRVAAIIFSVAVFAVSSIYIGFTFQWGPIAKSLKEVNLIYLILEGGSSIMLFWIIRALRWHLLLKQTDTVIPFFDIYMCTAVSLGLAIFTPLRSGEILKIELLRKNDLINRFPGYGSFIVERVLDLATILTIAGISLLTTFNILPNRSNAFYFIIASICLVVTGMYAVHKLRFTVRVQQLLDHINECTRNVPRLLLVTFITCVSWASVALTWNIFLRCGSLHLDFPKTIGLLSVVTLVSVFSLIPGGLGISEAGTSQVLIWLGFASTAAQTGSLVLRSSSLIAGALGLVHLALWKVIRKRRNHRSAAASFAIIPKEADTAGAD
jgi:uncharacterized membrane protein YbhN (UPF0104 family)